MKTDIHQHLWTQPLVDALARRSEHPFVRDEHGLTVLFLAGERPYVIDLDSEEASRRAELARRDGLNRALVCLSSPLGIESLPRKDATELIDAYHDGALELGEPFGVWGALALDRLDPVLPLSPGRLERHGFEYRRNGTLNLFAALNVATGEVRKKTTKSKTRIDFQAFMDEVVKDAPADQEIHVILDNYATHKKNDEWLKAHPNVTFHFTPTSASWLNQIEIWFGILGRKALDGASFNSPEDLAKAIDEFCEVWHENAHPFVWKKREVRGSQIRNTIVNLLE